MSKYLLIFAALNKKLLNMKKYLVTSYLVENGSWQSQGSYSIDSEEFAKSVHYLECCGFRVSMSNIFVKTFISDSNKHLAYSIVECPNL